LPFCARSPRSTLPKASPAGQLATLEELRMKYRSWREVCD